VRFAKFIEVANASSVLDTMQVELELSGVVFYSNYWIYTNISQIASNAAIIQSVTDESHSSFINHSTAQIHSA
jgi:hypothetical protein